jgi:hypothetical protein
MRPADRVAPALGQCSVPCLPVHQGAPGQAADSHQGGRSHAAGHWPVTAMNVPTAHQLVLQASVLLVEAASLLGEEQEMPSSPQRCAYGRSLYNQCTFAATVEGSISLLTAQAASTPLPVGVWTCRCIRPVAAGVLTLARDDALQRRVSEFCSKPGQQGKVALHGTLSPGSQVTVCAVELGRVVLS